LPKLRADRIVEVAAYGNPDGIRVKADHRKLEVYNYGTVNESSAQLERSETAYLIDAYNHTGYSQVLEETAFCSNRSLAKNRS
jgi:hypothetical protein